MYDPFDARKVMLSDELRPAGRRRTVSLVTALRAALLEGRQDVADNGQAAYLRQVIDELTARGIDGDCIVRFGLGPELLASIIARVLPYWMPSMRVLPSGGSVAEQESPGVQLAQLGSRGRTWDGIVGPIVERAASVPRDARLVPDVIVKIIRATIDLIYPWVLSASLVDLISLNPPAAEQFRDSGISVPPERDTLDEYRWMVDRFSGTRLREWSTTSLHREHKWRQGYYPPPCSDNLMSDRVVEGNQLNSEIARRAVDAGPHRNAGDPPGLNRTLVQKIKRNAIELLRGARCAEAAALFEFALGESPNDPELHNNLGFCLMPQDPRRALAILDDANRRGYDRIAINLYNRVLCKMQLGDVRAALEMVASKWDDVSDDSAVLWTQGDHGLELREDVDPRKELAALAYEAAVALGDSAAAERWAEVLDGEG